MHPFLKLYNISSQFSIFFTILLTLSVNFLIIFIGDEMKHNEMLKTNSILVFEAVNQGYDTIIKLTEHLGLGHATVEKVCTDLVNRKILISEKLKSGAKGRCAFSYSVCRDHYCAYVEESEECFSCILINMSQYAIERFDKRKFVYSVPLSEVISRVDKAITSRDDYTTFCKGIYISCNDDTASLIPPYFKRINKEDFIVNALKSDDKISVFEFPNKCILSIYGNIIHTNAKRRGIEHVFTPDEIFKIKKPFYEEIFLALQMSAFKELKLLI